jgi:hypothetical protein
MSNDTLKKHFLQFEGDWRGSAETKERKTKSTDQTFRKSTITTGGKIWYMFPDYAVYINGVDFADLVESISINHNNLGQPSSASVTLVNPELILNYTEKNIPTLVNPELILNYTEKNIPSGTWNDYRLSGTGKNTKSDPTGTGAKDHIAKRDNKVLETGEALKKAMYENKQSYQSSDKMWPLRAGDCCIDTNDPVRIFLKDPYIGNIQNDEKIWMFGFTGFVDNVTDSEDADMNSTIAISISDSRKIMRNSRMATNTGVDIALIKDRVDALQKDIGDPGAYTTKFKGLTLPQVIIAMINGTQFLQSPGSHTPIRTGGASDPFKQTLEGEEIGGVGEYEVHLHAFSPDESLSSWQEKFDMRLSKTDVETWGKGTRWGGDYWPGNKFNERIMILMPKGKGGDIIGLYPRTDIGLYSEFQNRLDFLNEKIQQADMEFYCTPKGDLVFEIKLYSLNSWDFGDKWGAKNWNTQPNWGILQESDCIDNYTITDSDADVITHTRITGAPVNNEGIANLEIGNKGLIPLAGSFGVGKPVKGKVELGAVSPEEMGMLRRFGLRYNQKSLPHIAEPDKLQLYAESMYEMQKANMKTANVTLLPNFEIGINRPFLLGARAKQFLISNISHTISWNGSLDTSLTLNYGRSYMGNGEFTEWKHPFLYSEGF